MADIPEGFKPADFSGRFLAHAGPYYIKRGENCWLLGVRLNEEHGNYIDIAHGGVLSTLADVALSMQVYVSEKPYPTVTTTSLTTNFIAPARVGDWLLAESSIEHLGKRTAHVSGRITCEDKVLATMTGVFNIFREKQ